MILLNKIKDRAKNEEKYMLGYRLFCEGTVCIDSCQSFWKEELQIKGTVQKEQVEIEIQNGDISASRCSCSEGNSMGNFCEHGVALALAYNHLTAQNPTIQVQTSPIMQKALHSYTVQSIEQAVTKEKLGDVYLEPIIRDNGKQLSVSFKVGNAKRSYIIKNLNIFYRAMKEEEEREYGKNLRFVHSRLAFQEDNFPILDFLMKALDERAYYYQLYSPYRTQTVFGERELDLSATELDEFFFLYQKKTITIINLYEEKNIISILWENPNVKIKIQSLMGVGCEILIKGEIQIFFGAKRIYVLYEGIFYCCEEKYSRQMRAFFQAVQDGKRELHIGKRDLPNFCGHLFPILKKNTDLTTEFDLEPYSPQPVEAEFYFDILEGEEKQRPIVILKECLKYGEFSFNPVIGTSVPVQIYRDYPAEYRISKVVERYFSYYDSEQGFLMLKEDEEIFSLISEGMEEFMGLGSVYLSDAFRTIKLMPPKAISIGVSLEGNLLKLKMDTGDLSEEELRALLESYQKKKKFYRMKNGDFIRIEDTALSIVSEFYNGLALSAKKLKSKEVELPAYRAMYVEQVLSDYGGTMLFRDRRFKQMIRDMKNIEDSDFEVPVRLAPIMRSYQKCGYRWLKTLAIYGFGGILADDMGLGKTIQVIALLTDEMEALEKKPALIICPASLVYNWENEIRRFSPELSFLTINGNGKERNELLQDEKTYCVWITSYDLLKKDLKWYQEREFSYQIIDEAQMIKNPSTQVTKAVKAIRAEHKFALTGTPIENRLSELWSIFDYTMPGFLFTYRYFKEEFETPIVKDEEKRAMQRLKHMIGPFLLRRKKQDVLKELPDKIETVVYAKMEKEQYSLYTAQAWKLKEEISSKSETEFSKKKLQVLAELTKLRQCCCDPHLCYEKYTGQSAKLMTCLELVEEGILGGHKILLFSQFTSMLDIIEKELKKREIKSYRITGQTPKKERIELVERFNQDDVPIFLISLKAGGTGINLTGADIVIHYDPWWNLAAQAQATDRAYRIGQKRNVNVFRLIVKGTIEENIIRLQECKRDLVEHVIGSEEMGFGALNLNEFLELLEEREDSEYAK